MINCQTQARRDADKAMADAIINQHALEQIKALITSCGNLQRAPVTVKQQLSRSELEAIYGPCPEQGE
jgi:hypothetical protein